MKTLNYYLANPCLCLALEKAFGLPAKAYSLDALEKFMSIWKDGYTMGRYCEATKDAEGS